MPARKSHQKGTLFANKKIIYLIENKIIKNIINKKIT